MYKGREGGNPWIILNCVTSSQFTKKSGRKIIKLWLTFEHPQITKIYLLQNEKQLNYSWLHTNHFLKMPKISGGGAGNWTRAARARIQCVNHNSTAIPHLNAILWWVNGKGQTHLLAPPFFFATSWLTHGRIYAFIMSFRDGQGPENHTWVFLALCIIFLCTEPFFLRTIFE